MKKRIISFALVLMLCIAFAVPAFAADLPRFVDYAGLLMEEEALTLTSKLDEISQRLSFDVVVMTVDTVNGNDPEDFSCQIYDNYNYGFGENNDGVILLISMEERDWVITSTGFGETAINSDARSYISDNILDDLRDGRYASAFYTFADNCDELVSQAQNGNTYKAPFNAAKTILIAFAVSLVISLIVVSSMKGKLKTVKMQTAAAEYVKQGSLNITQAHEHFMYHTITRTERPKNDSSNSSGSSHSSSSGKF